MANEVTATTTFEEASRCPKCDQPGSETSVRPSRDNSKIHIMTCMNPRCSWYETDWIVQTLSDGTVPVRVGGRKSFPAIPGMTQEKAEAELRRESDIPKP